MKIVILLAAIALPLSSLAQSEWFEEQLAKAKTPEDRALVYYDDFLQSHRGEHPWWSPFDTGDTAEPRHLVFSHSADSALAILGHLYWQEDNEHLYFPIVQLEHALGRKHDAAVIPPDTSEYYMPLQSGTYANLGPGWETNYRQHLLLLTQWAVLSCKRYTQFFRTLREPDLWHMQGDTILRMTVDHLPGDDISLIRLFKQNGQPKALYISAHQEYKNKKWHIVADERKEKTISLNQWHEAMHLAASIDTLPWVDKGQTIDGNRYQFEYRHADSFHSHYSCFDRTGLGGFLFRLFYKDYKDFDE